MRRPDRGQATVELALILPIVAITLLVVLQLMSVIRDDVALVEAARAAARRAMVEPDEASVRAAAATGTRLDPSRLSVSLSGDRSTGGQVTVVVTYRAPTDVPIVGRFVGDVHLSQRFTALRE
jgi:Flp pilus assembly protein TadG